MGCTSEKVGTAHGVLVETGVNVAATAVFVGVFVLPPGVLVRVGVLVLPAPGVLVRVGVLVLAPTVGVGVLVPGVPQVPWVKESAYRRRDRLCCTRTA